MNHLVYSKISNQVKEHEIISTLITGNMEDQAYVMEYMREEFFTHVGLVNLFHHCRELTATHQALNPTSVEDMVVSRSSPTELDFMKETLTNVLLTGMEDSVENTVSRLRETYMNRIIYNEVIIDNHREFTESPVTPDELIRRITNTLVKLDFSKSVRATSDVVNDVLTEIMNPSEGNKGLETGLANFDNHFGGITKDTVMTIGGFSGSGKTAFVVDLIHRLCKRHKDKIAICLFSLEMSQKRIVRRLISRHARLTAKRLRHHGQMGQPPMNEIEKQNVTNAALDISYYPLNIYYETISARDIKVKARSFALKNKGKHLIYILDHLGEAQKESNDNRIETDRVMQAMKDLCIEYEATSIPLTQLSKAVEDPKNGPFFKPARSYIMESVGVIAKSDIVLLFWRPEVYQQFIPDYADMIEWPTKDKLVILVEKNRDGKAGIDLLQDCNIRYNEIKDYTTPIAMPF